MLNPTLSCVICTFKVNPKYLTVNNSLNYNVLDLCPLHQQIYLLLGEKRFNKKYSFKKINKVYKVEATNRYVRRRRYYNFL